MATTTQTRSRETRRETVLKTHLRDEMNAGIAAARDPDNAELPDLYARQTTIYSPWYTRTCPECKHKFREGDRVRLCPLCGQAYHDDDQYELDCWKDHFANSSVCRKGRRDPITNVFRPGCGYRWSGTFPDKGKGADAESQPTRRVFEVTTQFLRGLENVWSPFGEELVFEVQAGTSTVGHKCPWCRFQIRAGDRVVKCPCGNCDTYFHDDIFRHLMCWDEWNGSQGNDYCPTTGARIERSLVSAQAEGGDGDE